jgi:erythromycin esterase-like protein
MGLQEELLMLADKLMLVEENEKYKEENEMLMMRDKHSIETIKALEEKLEEADKKYCMEEISRKMYIKMQ